MKPDTLILSVPLLAAMLLGGCYIEDPSGCGDCTPDSGVGSIDVDDDGDGFSEDEGDCNDAAPDVHPFAIEPEDGVDNDCDGSIDEGMNATYPPGETPTAPEPTPEATPAAPTPTDIPPEPTDVPVTPTPEPTPTAEPTPYPDPVDATPDVVLGPDASGDKAAVLSDLRFIGDFDGDGYDDFAASIQMGTEGRVYLYYGGPDALKAADVDALDRVADAVILGIGAPNTSGVRLGVGGDINGDGTDDILLGDIYQRRATVFLGGHTRLSGEVAAENGAVIFHSFIEGSYGLGLGMAIVQDMDGDGKDEIALGIPAYDLGRGEVALFYGRDDFSGVIDTAGADVRFRGAIAEGATGSQVFSLGDLDSDGFGELGIVSSAVPHGPDTTVTRGTFSVVYGNDLRPTGVVPLTGLPTLYAPLSTSLVGMAADTGDMDGDGHRDVAIGIPSDGESRGQGWLLYGSEFRLPSGNIYIDELASPVTGRDEHDVAFGASVALAGDITGNGRSDLVVASPRLRGDQLIGGGQVPDPSELDSRPGYAVIFAGNPQLDAWSINDQAWGFIDGELLGYDILWPVASGGDLDGDGQSELLVGATNFDASGEAFSSILVMF